jgi:hypothetical protein
VYENECRMVWLYMSEITKNGKKDKKVIKMVGVVV